VPFLSPPVFSAHNNHRIRVHAETFYNASATLSGFIGAHMDMIKKVCSPHQYPNFNTLPPQILKNMYLSSILKQQVNARHSTIVCFKELKRDLEGVLHVSPSIPCFLLPTDDPSIVDIQSLNKSMLKATMEECLTNTTKDATNCTPEVCGSLCLCLWCLICNLCTPATVGHVLPGGCHNAIQRAEVQAWESIRHTEVTPHLRIACCLHDIARNAQSQ